MESQSLAAKRSSMTGFDDDSATGSEAPSPESMAWFEELDPADNRLSRGSVKSTNSGWFGVSWIGDAVFGAGFGEHLRVPVIHRQSRWISL